jgi:oligopeptide/dipeptide ABC transporter ATP-binding protein
MTDPILQVRDLRVSFGTHEGRLQAIDAANLDIYPGRTLCLVGESGSGKSVTARAIMRILPTIARIETGEMRLLRRDGRRTDIAALAPKGPEVRAVRGGEIGMIFQEPMSSLSVFHTIGSQIMEVLRLHTGVDRRTARATAIEALRRVGMPDPETRVDAYPFQLSGGMRQRAMIAMALACRPRILIADEPTTALDVSTQAQILDLIRDLQAEYGMAVLFITHDLGVVAEIADEVAVMYLGQIVERGPVQAIFDDPCHPYTAALLGSIPRSEAAHKSHVQAIRGAIPNAMRRPAGCAFHSRCTHAMPNRCDREAPDETSLAPGRAVRCLLYPALKTSI